MLLKLSKQLFKISTDQSIIKIIRVILTVITLNETCLTCYSVAGGKLFCDEGHRPRGYSSLCHQFSSQSLFPGVEEEVLTVGCLNCCPCLSPSHTENTYSGNDWWAGLIVCMWGPCGLPHCAATLGNENSMKCLKTLSVSCRKWWRRLIEDRFSHDLWHLAPGVSRGSSDWAGLCVWTSFRRKTS